MKPAEIRALSDTELLNELETATQRLFSLRFQRTTQNLESTAELRNVRRDIARMHTVLAERERVAAAAEPAEHEGPDR
ncbi:MAG: 50S ribosomal protein L29 [Planctomycetota bacterium]